VAAEHLGDWHLLTTHIFDAIDWNARRAVVLTRIIRASLNVVAAIADTAIPLNVELSKAGSVPLHIKKK
jgi:hypothetical protein